ncbi:hypothetical protein D3C79_664060 [compost metagenome]
MADQGQQVLQPWRCDAFEQHRHRQHRTTREQLLAPRRREEHLLRAVPDIELEEQVRQLVVEHAVALAHHLAKQHVAVFQVLEQPVFVTGRPLLELAELALAAATGQVMATRLQQQLAGGGKTDRGIGAVELFLDHQVLTVQTAVGQLIMVAIAGLQAGTLQVWGARVLVQVELRELADIECHGSSPKGGKPTTAGR